MNRFIEHRQAAIDWLNGKREFSAGIDLLRNSGFKPGVVNKLYRQGAGAPDAMGRLTFLVRELVKAWNMTSEELNDDTDPDTGLPAGDEQPTEQDEAMQKRLVDQLAVVETGENPNPENVSKLIRLYARAYRDREIALREMEALPEENTSVIQAERKVFLGKMAECSALMERLYPLYEGYCRMRKDITAAELEAAVHQPKPVTAEKPGTDACDYATMSLEELKKLRKSIATKILRANNQLEYQQETRAAERNPMPESPKRVKLERKVKRLTAELEKLDYFLAEMV